MTNYTVAISPFANSTYSGHSLLDDEFYFGYLLQKRENFIFYTSNFSANRIVRKYPHGKPYLRVVSSYIPWGLGHFFFALSLKVPKNANVVFLGYSERLVLIWSLLNIIKPIKLVLVATNNISTHRIVIYRRQLQFFFWFIGPKLRRLVLHTDYEVYLVNTLSKRVAKRCFVKKHHLMIPKIQKCSNILEKPITISYFGPRKSEKPLMPMMELVKADESETFVFKFFNVERSAVLEELGTQNAPSNVKISDTWLSEDEYISEVMASDLILMTHTKEFEGKLSGNLCDCIAYGVPYIAAPMEPHVSMRSRYGDIGYLCDFSDHRWAKSLLGMINRSKINTMVDNIQHLGKDYSLSDIIQNLDQAFSVQKT